MYETDQNLQFKVLFGSQIEESSTPKTTMLDKIVANKGNVITLHWTVRGDSRSKPDSYRHIVNPDV